MRRTWPYWAGGAVLASAVAFIGLAIWLIVASPRGIAVRNAVLPADEAASVAIHAAQTGSPELKLEGAPQEIRGQLSDAEQRWTIVLFGKVIVTAAASNGDSVAPATTHERMFLALNARTGKLERAWLDDTQATSATIDTWPQLTPTDDETRLQRLRLPLIVLALVIAINAVAIGFAVGVRRRMLALGGTISDDEDD